MKCKSECNTTVLSVDPVVNGNIASLVFRRLEKLTVVIDARAIPVDSSHGQLARNCETTIGQLVIPNSEAEVGLCYVRPPAIFAYSLTTISRPWVSLWSAFKGLSDDFYWSTLRITTKRPNSTFGHAQENLYTSPQNQYNAHSQNNRPTLLVKFSQVPSFSNHKRQNIYTS